LTPANPERKGGRGRRLVLAAIVLVVVAAAGAGYALTRGPPPVNLLTDGGFSDGSLQGWQTVPPYLPAVESAVVAKGSAYAARFQTTTNDPAVAGPCLTRGTDCGVLNVSTIYQSVEDLTVSGGTRFSIAVYPMFQPPSAFQVTFEFGLSPSAVGRTGYTDVLLFYVVVATPQQCSSYGGYLVQSIPRGTTAASHCLPAPQGSWSSFSRGIAADLPSGITAADLEGSALTVSVSFAGAGPADEIYVDAMSLS
jgi:hypothetical protein